MAPGQTQSASSDGFRGRMSHGRYGLATARRQHSEHQRGNFFREVLAVFGDRHQIGLLRADSGFCIGSFLDLVESKNVSYIVVARVMRTIKRKLSGLQDWVELDGRTAVAEFMYQAEGWSKARRVVVVRHRTEDQRAGQTLLECRDTRTLFTSPI